MYLPRRRPEASGISSAFYFASLGIEGDAPSASPIPRRTAPGHSPHRRRSNRRVTAARISRCRSDRWAKISPLAGSTSAICALATACARAVPCSKSPRRAVRARSSMSTAHAIKQEIYDSRVKVARPHFAPLGHELFLLKCRRAGPGIGGRYNCSRGPRGLTRWRARLLSGWRPVFPNALPGGSSCFWRPCPIRKRCSDISNGSSWKPPPHSIASSVRPPPCAAR